MSIQSYKDLEVWQKSIEAVTVVYSLTKSFPKEEMYGLTSQMRRSAVSIPSNIAEGRGKRSTGDFIRFLNIAYGSAAELETQLLISQNLGYMAADVAGPLEEKISRICKMLNGLINSLDKASSPNPESRILNPKAHHA